LPGIQLKPGRIKGEVLLANPVDAITAGRTPPKRATIRGNRERQGFLSLNSPVFPYLNNTIQSVTQSVLDSSSEPGGIISTVSSPHNHCHVYRHPSSVLYIGSVWVDLFIWWERFNLIASKIASMSVTGVTFGNQDPEFLLNTAKLAEEHGLDSVWVGEAWGRNAVPLITRLLENTKSIDVCTGIINVYSRSPALVAMTANTLADIGNGRFRLGIGASSSTVIENFHGMPFDPPLRRTREYIEIIQQFLDGETVEYEGELFELDGFSLDMPTYHDCSIYVAAMGEMNRQLTGEFADGWMPLLVPHTGFSNAIEAVERGVNKRGREMSEVDAAPWVPCCISESDPDTAREHVRSLIGFYIGGMGDYYARVATEFGFGDSVESIQEGWAQNGHTGAVDSVPDRMISAFGAAGTPAEAKESFDRFSEAGADSPIAYVPSQFASEPLSRETITHL
jgi:alkanesulfonate monooxygenase SsuD/methylene tetrahydromethanopterin reductase-like flavin-dependent oxidoreductase (luciferase family)